MAVPHNYIVMLHPAVKNMDGHVAAVKKITSKHNAAAQLMMGGDFARPTIKNEIHTVWKNSINGYAATLTQEALTELRNLPEVKLVEEDGIVTTNDQQNDAPWGLGRISSRDRVANPSTYFYDGVAGAGVKVFVIDTGIRISHQDFGGRASWGANFVSDGQDSDQKGHGTHVAGTIAGRTYGVAKNAEVVAVKVLNAKGSGTNSGVITGINWVIQQHNSGNGGRKGTVINMSLGGGKSDIVNSATEAAVGAGVHVAVAAGNSATDACNKSPASAKGVLSVAASDVNDNLADFSNYGSCTNVIAPGVDVLSAWFTSDTATNTISGTSMATPGVAGVAAYFLSLSSTSMTPAALIQKIQSSATQGAISNVSNGTPNLLLYNSFF
ncbi:putative serine proteinase, precursor [Ramicandelaber brevisporus]|nr:putative serine proteinase, precursor [Ramicandelaber brevisporus]